jgi:hypothetical protein
MCCARDEFRRVEVVILARFGLFSRLEDSVLDGCNVVASPKMPRSRFLCGREVNEWPL